MSIAGKYSTVLWSLSATLLMASLSFAQSSDESQQGASHKFELPDGLKWETNDEDPIFADPKAKKGGVYRSYMPDFPPTLRQVGPNSNSGFRGYLDANDMYLVEIHPNTGKFIPSLATHWAAAPDNKTVYYKLDGRARWSSGEPVSAEDYLFTLEFMRSPHIKAPWYNNYYTNEIAEIKKHSNDVISVVSTKSHMDFTLIQMTSLSPTPKHFYKMDKNWVRSYNWKLKPNTGPYKVSKFKKGKFVTFERKKDWWAQDLKYYKHRYNVDTQHIKVIRDTEAAWQAFLKGEISSHHATLPGLWHDKAQGDAFSKGYIKKLWFYYQSPQGANIIWLNEQKHPWQDANVRHAFAHALNFKKVIDEVLRGDYERVQSFLSGYGGYDNAAIKARTYDVVRASEYMKKSGWSLGKEGFWQKDGKPLQVTVTYASKYHTERLVILKEEAKKAGFDIVLEQLDHTANYKKTQEKNHQIFWGMYSTGSLPPPRYWQYFHSTNAKPQSNNFTMTQDPQLDALIDEYRDTFDEQKKMDLSRKILQKIHDIGSFIPGFSVPFNRMLYWRGWKFPQVPGTKLGGINTSAMWFDAEEAAEVKKYQKAGKSFGESVTMDTTYR